MFPVAFASRKRAPALKLPNGARVPSSCRDLATLYPHLSSFFRSASAVSIISFIVYSVATLIAISVPAWLFLYSDRNKKLKEPNMPAAEDSEESPDGMNLGPTDEYVHNEPPELDSDVDQKSFCEICLENKDSWQMFANDACSHSFCYECTSAHISAKIEGQAKEIACPDVNCHHMLNRHNCRLMIPSDTLVQWDESLCLSLIPESQKLYCPFRDCSAMLVNDSGETVTQIRCPVCKRAFCAECHVPWHSEFTCKEFRKLNGGKLGEDERIVKVLAKKKKWQKCPKCRMYVEKIDGCLHIMCRCSYEFCYKCGGKWTGWHEICLRPKWWISLEEGLIAFFSKH